MQTPFDGNTPPRFYQLQIQPDLLDGWMLIRESGYQGERGSHSQDYFEYREEAERAFIKRRDQQLKRGFQITFATGEPLSQDS